MPRVIAGKYRGIPLVTPKGQKTRPTADKVKESLFSILHAELPGAVFLDLFAGSGQMGFEAVSRGAARCVLVDTSRAAREAQLANREKTRTQDLVEILTADVFRILEVLAGRKDAFDVIFMDPPYDRAVDFVKKVGAAVSRLGLLKPGGILVAEHDSSDNMDEIVMNLTSYRCCRYGNTMLTFYSEKDYEAGEVPLPSENDDIPGEFRSLHTGSLRHSDESDGVL